ncbi:MAG TPA: methyltransferase type 12 [Thermomicrobiales bacterium]|jgi:predicted nicotinamide N-methyase
MEQQDESFPFRELGTDPDDAALEIAELARWIEARVATRDRLITLPYTGERFAIRSPARAGHDRFFAAARATSEKQLPYWVDIWPSGVALADLALSRADDLTGRPVLELGCGLGVTATAALAAGADLYVADYAPLSLAFCRLNALRNVARAPRPLAFNWRDPLPELLASLGHLPPFPIILAADILYERRDIGPVLALIERLLAPGGQLWLAEPGRQTARSFLNALTAAGWRGATDRFDGPWPGGQAARVRIHLLHR